MKGIMTGDRTKEARLTRAGLLLFISGFVIFMGIITGEILYTLDFNTRDNYISELAAALPEGTITPQPSAGIFNVSMMISGLMVLISSYFTYRAGGAERWVFYPLVLWITGFGGYLLGLKDVSHVILK